MPARVVAYILLRSAHAGRGARSGSGLLLSPYAFARKGSVVSNIVRKVVHTTPHCASPFTCAVAPPITAANVPPIAANPPAADHITFDRTTRTLHVPD